MPNIYFHNVLGWNGLSASKDYLHMDKVVQGNASHITCSSIDLKLLAFVIDILITLLVGANDLLLVLCA